MPQRVALLTFPKAEMLDAVGPLEVFAGANARLGRRGYDLELVSLRPGPLEMSSGLSLVAGRGLAEDTGRIDTLLVGGGEGARRHAGDPEVQAWLRCQAPRARRLGAVCTGAFVLAAGGYLDGRRATTHWQRCAELAAAYPAVRVEPDAIFRRDGKVVTSAGITAGIDLALHLVEEDFGRALAFAVARHMVVYARRAGGQSQFSADLMSQAAAGGRFDALRRWIQDHPGAELGVEALAERAGMSPRSFHRHFTAETGMTPGAFVERARVEAARRALEEGGEPLARLSHRLGFGHVDSLRRIFHRHLSMSPQDYRQRWAQGRLPDQRVSDNAEMEDLKP